MSDSSDLTDDLSKTQYCQRGQQTATHSEKSRHEAPTHVRFRWGSHSSEKAVKLFCRLRHGPSTLAVCDRYLECRGSQPEALVLVPCPALDEPHGRAADLELSSVAPPDFLVKGLVVPRIPIKQDNFPTNKLPPYSSRPHRLDRVQP